MGIFKLGVAHDDYHPVCVTCIILALVIGIVIGIIIG